MYGNTIVRCGSPRRATAPSAATDYHRYFKNIGRRKGAYPCRIHYTSASQPEFCEHKNIGTAIVKTQYKLLRRFTQICIRQYKSLRVFTK